MYEMWVLTIYIWCPVDASFIFILILQLILQSMKIISNHVFWICIYILDMVIVSKHCKCTLKILFSETEIMRDQSQFSIF